MSFVRSLVRLRGKGPEGRPEWLIAGLGNPGARYAKTRHNIGFMCVNRIAHQAGARFRGGGRDRADVALAVIAGVEVLLAQPQTYMNDSGAALARLGKRYRIPPNRTFVIYDDVDLPFATIRVREAGSAGGHRGIQSVIDHLGTAGIPRVRVGIGRDASDAREYVLAEFSPEERRAVPAVCDTVAAIVSTVVAEGVVAAMNRFNGQAGAAGRQRRGAPTS